MLHNAVINKNARLVSELLAAGADRTLLTENGLNIFHLVAMYPSIAVVDAIRANEVSLSEELDEILAIEAQRVSTGEDDEDEFQIPEGAVTKVRNYQDKYSKSISAIEQNHALLLQRAPNGDGGETPLQMAIRLKHQDICTHLVDTPNLVEVERVHLSENDRRAEVLIDIKGEPADAKLANPALVDEILKEKGLMNDNALLAALRHENYNAFNQLFVLHPQPHVLLSELDLDGDGVFYYLAGIKDQEVFNSVVSTMLSGESKVAKEVANVLALSMVRNLSLLWENDISKDKAIRKDNFVEVNTLVAAILLASPDAFVHSLAQFTQAELMGFLTIINAMGDNNTNDGYDVLFQILNECNTKYAKQKEALLNIRGSDTSDGGMTLGQMMHMGPNAVEFTRTLISAVVDPLVQVGQGSETLLYKVAEHLNDPTDQEAIERYFEYAFAGMTKKDRGVMLHNDQSCSPLKIAMDTQNYAFLRAVFNFGKNIVKDIANGNKDRNGHPMGLMTAALGQDVVTMGIIVGDLDRFPVEPFVEKGNDGKSILDKLSALKEPQPFIAVIEALALDDDLRVEVVQELFNSNEVSLQIKSYLQRVNGTVTNDDLGQETTMFSPMRDMRRSLASRDRQRLDMSEQDALQLEAAASSFKRK